MLLLLLWNIICFYAIFMIRLWYCRKKIEISHTKKNDFYRVVKKKIKWWKIWEGWLDGEGGCDLRYFKKRSISRYVLNLIIKVNSFIFIIVFHHWNQFNEVIRRLWIYGKWTGIQFFFYFCTLIFVLLEIGKRKQQISKH